MEIIRITPATVAFLNINNFQADLLRRIPEKADPGEDKAARDRLFSKPSKGGPAWKEFNQEWKQYVQPDLQHLFESANETVAEDLKNFTAMGGEGVELYSLLVPVNHFEQWLNSLNQARLVMAARNAFTEEELSEDYALTSINSERDLDLVLMHFYSNLLAFFIYEFEQSTEDEDPSSL